MIQLFFLGGLLIYLLIGMFIILSTLKTIKGRVIGFIILALIPSWDVIIGYPVFLYLCKYKSGVKIYKTVKNVEGFFIGKIPSQAEPVRLYNHYNYVEYQRSSNLKYYRSYWLNNINSDLCVKPKSTWYIEEFNKGRCLAREEVQFNQLSQFELKSSKERYMWKSIFPLLGIYKNPTQISYDRKTKEILGELIIYHWDKGWIHNFLMNGTSLSRCNFTNILDVYNEALESVLKPNKE